jgi:hypothetical protein
MRTGGDRCIQATAPGGMKAETLDLMMTDGYCEHVKVSTLHIDSDIYRMVDAQLHSKRLRTGWVFFICWVPSSHFDIFVKSLQRAEQICE